MAPHVFPEGTIRTSSNGIQRIKRNNKWEYLKKEKKPRKKKEKPPLVIEYIPIQLPPNIKETKYPGYYVSTEGRVYRNPIDTDYVRKIGKKRFLKTREETKINEYGLIELNLPLRGNPKYKKYQYPCANVSITDENTNYRKQIKVYAHRLVAETFIPNPQNLPEIDHIDRNKCNNHVSNLRWITRNDNMNFSGIHFEIYDTLTGETHKGKNVQEWVNENWEWLSTRVNRTPKSFYESLFKYNKCKEFIFKKL